MPTTTNLGLTYPASSGYVTNGASDMGTLASNIDAFFGAPTTYTPTLTNVTSGTASGRYVRMGKLGLVSIGISAGTATAAGTISATLPSGWTTVAVIQIVPAVQSTTTAVVISVTAAASATTVVIRADAAGANFGLGASVVGVRLNGWLFLA